MSSIILTDLTIRSLKAEQRTDYWDVKTPSFGVRVGKRSKVFIAKLQNRRVTIGMYPAISLADARRKALSLKSDQAPMPVATVTFEYAYEKFKEAHCSRKRDRTQRDYKRVLEKHFLPYLRTTRLSRITAQKLALLTDPLLPTPSEYGHALGVARTFFKWCVRPPHRYLTHSPLEGLQISTGESRTRVLNDNELKKVWSAAIEQGNPHGAAVRLLILTGQRRGEISSLRWPWINERDRTITLPASITKNNKEHTFPYSRMVADTLETIPRLNSTDLLFPARGNDQCAISGWSKFKQEMAEGVSGWTLHDLRRTFATNLAALGTPIHVTEKLLNHVSGTQSGIVGVYQRHSYAAEMREAIENWEKYLTALRMRASRGAKVRERSNLSALVTYHRMTIEVCVRWDRMSMQEVGAQMSAQCNDHYGDVGYLREPYYGKPYPTQVLAPEAFRYGRARIAATDLQKRLPDALYLVETREQCFGNEAAVERVQKQYRDFVALCARKEEECGIPCMIIASA